MSASRQVIPIDPEFFCDGHYYVLTSLSLGGSHLTAEQLSEQLRGGDAQTIRILLQEGICLPLFFDGDCALDHATTFVVGDLDETEEQNWIGCLTSKLHIPCGKLLLLCGGGDPNELEEILSGKPPAPHYVIFQVIEVPPQTYRVDVYAYLSSMTVQQSLSYYDQHFEEIVDQERLDHYLANRPGIPGTDYIIQLRPCQGEVPLPELVPELDWGGVFQFRR
ncbi:MAG: hypothetical protein NW237_13935 [Cyanobacteriota bacterium]|nr:hypothetical protein [Cyanobacteriota bacterium]